MTPTSLDHLPYHSMLSPLTPFLPSRSLAPFPNNKVKVVRATLEEARALLDEAK
jgi:hypothetical protein